jgi:superfamily II DNA/RNA helicase
VHRIGRTGRFGAFGVAVSLISSPDDEAMINEITRIYGHPGIPLIHEVTTYEQVYTKVRSLVTEPSVFPLEGRPTHTSSPQALIWPWHCT